MIARLRGFQKGVVTHSCIVYSKCSLDIPSRHCRLLYIWMTRNQSLAPFCCSTGSIWTPQRGREDATTPFCQEDIMQPVSSSWPRCSWAGRSGWRGSLRLACGCTRIPAMSPVALDRPVLIPQILSRGLPVAVLLLF